MDQELWDVIYYEESRDEFFRNNRELDAAFARQLIEGAGQAGVEFVFANLSAFKESDRAEIAEIFAQHFKLDEGQTQDSYFAPSDEDFKCDTETTFSTLSSFMIAHGQFESLFDGNFRLKNPGSEQVLALVAISRFEEAVRYLDKIPIEQMPNVVSQFIEAGQSKLIFTYLEDSRNREFARTLSPDDVFRVLVSQEPNFYQLHDPFSTRFVVEQIGNMKSHTPEEVLLGILSVTDGMPIFYSREPITLSDPQRIMQAIEDHRNVGTIIQELKATYRESPLTLEIPAHIEIAYHVVPRNIDKGIIDVVKQAIAGIEINPSDLPQLTDEYVKSIIPQETLDRISELVLTQRIFFNDTIENQIGHIPLLQIPPRVQRIMEENPGFSDKSVCITLSLFSYDDGKVVYHLKDLGVTDSGEQGYQQLQQILERVNRELDSRDPLSVPIQTDSYYDSTIVRDVISLKLKTILSELEASQVKVPFGEFLSPEQVEQNQQDLARAFERIDAVFSSAGMRIVQDGKDIGSFLKEFSYQLQGTALGTDDSLFIPSAFGDVGERFAGVDANLLHQIISLRFEREISVGTFETFGEVSGQPYTYADLTSAVDALTSQFDEKSALTFSIEDPLVMQITVHELKMRIYDAREIKDRLDTLTPGTDEYIELRAQHSRSLESIDRIFGAVALQQIQNGQPVTPFIEQFIERLHHAGAVSAGEFYIPSALNPIGDHFRVYEQSLIEDVISLRYGSEVSGIFREFGIERTGEAGYKQAQQIVSRIRADILGGNISESEKNLELYQLVFVDLIRLKSASYGAKDLEAVQRMLAVKQEEVPHGPGLIRPLERDQSTLVPNEQVAKAYNQIIDDFNRAAEIVGPQGDVDPQKLDELFGEIEELAKLEIEKLRVQLERVPADKTSRIDKLEGQISSLAQITKENLWMFPKMIQNIETLAGFKDMKSPLRQFLFVGAIAQHPNIDRSVFAPISQDGTLDQANAAAVADFVSHVAFQETWKELFESQSALKPLRHVMQSEDLQSFVKAVEERAQSKGTRTSFTVVPVRGPLLEASGSIADTCWNGRGINDEFPNITAVIIVKNSNVPMKSRVAGAALLIQGMSEDGQPLLIIRGLNPIQNDITQLMQDSFFREFAKFADGIAKAEGRKLAVVIDGHSGGAATNRPTLFAHLDSLRDQLEKVQLSDDESTTFNSYDIKGHTYLVDIDKLEETLDLVEQDRAQQRHSPSSSSGSFRPMNIPGAGRTPAPVPAIPRMAEIPQPDIPLL